MDGLMQPGTAPFWIALLTVAGLGLVELLSLLLGASASALIDHSLDLTQHPGDGHAGPLAGAMSWLNSGGVPLLVLLVILLSGFAIAGFALQAVASQVLAPLPTPVASLIALCTALPVTRAASRALARLIPRDESSVLTQAEFIGLTGTVTLGPLDQGHPGTIRVTDRHGNIHSLRTRAAAGHRIATGETVLVVDGADGLFLAIPAPEALRDRPSTE